MSAIRNWVRLEDAIREAGAAEDPAEAARELAEAGVNVTRDSRARWAADPRDPRVRAWLRDLAEAAGGS